MKISFAKDGNWKEQMFTAYSYRFTETPEFTQLDDCITTAAVLAAGLIEQFARIPVDGFMGLAVAVFILYSGIHNHIS